MLRDARYAMAISCLLGSSLSLFITSNISCLIAGDSKWKAQGPACQIYEVQGWVHDFFWSAC